MTKKRILVVEDYPAIAMDEEYILKHLGYDVVGISVTGEDAVQKVERESPDAVLMDIELKGDMDGVQAAQEIRNIRDIPVVFVTARNDNEVPEPVVYSDGYSCVFKPYTKDELAEAFDKVFTVGA